MLLVMATAYYSNFLNMSDCLQSPRSFQNFFLKCSHAHCLFVQGFILCLGQKRLRGTLVLGTSSSWKKYFLHVLDLWRLDQFMWCLQLGIMLLFIIVSPSSNAFITFHLQDMCFRIHICFKWIYWNYLKQLLTVNYIVVLITTFKIKAFNTIYLSLLFFFSGKSSP